MEKHLKKLLAEKDSIRSINLSRLHLDQVPEALRGCTKLENISLAENDIRTFPAWLFELPALKKLDISFNPNAVIPKALAKAQGLEKLVISAPQDKVLPQAVLQLTKLKTLHISGTLAALPDGLFALENLQEIELFETELTTIPAGIARLPKLKKFSMMQFWFSERLAVVDVEDMFDKLSRCAALRVLHLNIVNMGVLPDNIGLLRQLRELNLNSNGLQQMPTGLFELAGLRILDLGMNDFKYIPKEIARLTQLKTLIIHSNHSPPLDTRNLWQRIAVFEHLETLALWSCQAKMEIPEAISALKKLKSLDVDNNKITRLPKSLEKMVWLQKLRISTNLLPPSETERLRAALPNTRITA
ncbi:MAG: leucine-rich repeat protein [Neisseria sp.]|nr:leucine-rich repeat protein [Neisseria sp.]